MFTRVLATGIRPPLQSAGRFWLFLVAATFILASAPVAHAATITVIQTSDGVANAANCPGTLCRLRDAIAKANNGDTINFAFTGITILLTQGQLDINKDLTISVAVTCDITIDAHGVSRIFDVAAGKSLTLNGICMNNGFAPPTGNGGGIRVQNGGSLNLSNVIMQNNQATNAGPRGGAIYNNGTLNINGFAFFSGNTAGSISSSNDGGAIYNDGTANLNGVTDSSGVRSIRFYSNTASLDGGTLYNNGVMNIVNTGIDQGSAFAGGAIVNSGALTATHSLISSNSAATVGGGIVNQVGGVAMISDSTLDSNHAANTGGGILNSATMTLLRSTVSDNSSNSDAGGVLNGGLLTLVNVTISGNSARRDGGGLMNNDPSGTTSLNNVTISKNTADSNNSGTGNGGGILNVTGMVNIKNSILAANFDTANNAGPGAIHPDCSGTLNSQGHNLLRINTGCIGLVNGVNGNLVGTSGSPLTALLDDLANNGGSTQTHALRPNSPAIDAGNPAAPGSGGNACAIHDQRLFARGGALGQCDMGAYERGLFEYLPVIMR